jgi:hypothetical protein
MWSTKFTSEPRKKWSMRFNLLPKVSFCAPFFLPFLLHTVTAIYKHHRCADDKFKAQNDTRYMLPIILINCKRVMWRGRRASSRAIYPRAKARKIIHASDRWSYCVIWLNNSIIRQHFWCFIINLARESFKNEGKFVKTISRHIPFPSSSHHCQPQSSNQFSSLNKQPQIHENFMHHMSIAYTFHRLFPWDSFSFSFYPSCEL